MGFIVSSKKHIYIRIPLIIIMLLVLAISPILISMAGAWLTELITNEPCHEGNCIWVAFGWLFLVSVPTAILFAIIFLVIIVIDLVKLFRTES